MHNLLNTSNTFQESSICFRLLIVLERRHACVVRSSNVVNDAKIESNLDNEKESAEKLQLGKVPVHLTKCRERSKGKL